MEGCTGIHRFQRICVAGLGLTIAGLGLVWLTDVYGVVGEELLRKRTRRIGQPWVASGNFYVGEKPTV